MKLAIIPYPGKKLAIEYSRRIIRHLSELDCTFAIPNAFRDTIKCERSEYFNNTFETVEC